MSKKIIFFGFFLWMSVALYAQRNRVDYLPNFDKHKIHYGFYLGLNNNDFVVRHNNSTYITTNTTPGFNVGLILDYRLHKNINVRLEPGLMSNTKKVFFNNFATERDSVREASSTFLHFPVIFKFSTNRYNNIRPYVLAGVSYDYNFSSNETNQDDNSAGEFRMKTHNFMYEIGFGVDIYLYFFKFSPSIRGLFAINNELKYDNDPNSNWTAPINYLGTRGVFISLAFE